MRGAPSTRTDVRALDPPARAERGDEAHSRNTSSVTGRSGVNTTRCVPVTVRRSTVTSTVRSGLLGSGAAYDVQSAGVPVVPAGLVAGGLVPVATGVLGVADPLGLAVTVAVGVGAAGVATLPPDEQAASSTTTDNARTRPRTCRR